MFPVPVHGQGARPASFITQGDGGDVRVDDLGFPQGDLMTFEHLTIQATSPLGAPHARIGERGTRQPVVRMVFVSPTNKPDMTRIGNTTRRRATLFALGVAFICGTSLSLAQRPLYPAKETSYDLYALYLAPASGGLGNAFETVGDGSYGGGLGVNYFSSRHFGVGTDVVISNGGSFIDSSTVNLLGRWPFGRSGVAPYVVAGGGRSFDPSVQWIGQVGAGLEIRSSEKMGLFADGRYSWGEKYDNVLFRVGFRITY
jgi:hypothetical protein